MSGVLQWVRLGWWLMRALFLIAALILLGSWTHGSGVSTTGLTRLDGAQLTNLSGTFLTVGP